MPEKIKTEIEENNTDVCFNNSNKAQNIWRKPFKPWYKKVIENIK